MGPDSADLPHLNHTRTISFNCNQKARPMSRSQAIAQPDFVAFRAPLLPFDRFLEWGEGLHSANAIASSSDLSAALASDRAALRSKLASLLDTPPTRESLFVASPSLSDRIATWQQDPQSKQGRKAERSLARYFARMTGRGTPFGLFAGCGTGSIAEQTCLPAPTTEDCIRHTRLDMEYLFQLAEELAKVPELRTELKFFRNNTIYRAAGRLRYAESHLVGDSRSHRLVVVDETDYLLATLDRAADGARIADLAAPLVDDEISMADAVGFIEQLIDSQLLVSELQPPITGPSPLEHLLECLRQYPVASAIVEHLEQVRDGLHQLDAAAGSNPPEAYRSIAETLRELPAPVQLARLFQVDTIQQSRELTLGKDVADEILRGVEITRSMYRRMLDDLADFRKDFLERFGDREVPLMDALDEESGIGFRKSPLPNVEAEPTARRHHPADGHGSGHELDASAYTASPDVLRGDCGRRNRAGPLRPGHRRAEGQAGRSARCVYRQMHDCRRVAGGGQRGRVPDSLRGRCRSVGRTVARPLRLCRRDSERAGPAAPQARGVPAARGGLCRDRAPSRGPHGERSVSTGAARV